MDFKSKLFKHLKNNNIVPEQPIIYIIKIIKQLFWEIVFRNMIKKELAVLKKETFKEFHVINTNRKEIHNYIGNYVCFNDTF